MAKTDGRVESSNNYWHGKLSPHIHFFLASSLLRRLSLGCFGRRRWHGQALQSLARCSNARTTTATTAAVADALIDHGHHPARPTCEEGSFKQPKHVRIRQIQEKLSSMYMYSILHGSKERGHEFLCYASQVNHVCAVHLIYILLRVLM